MSTRIVMDMEGKDTVITGASQGIGRALVEATKCEATHHRHGPLDAAVWRSRSLGRFG
jgi:NAD(P)-dependent dehydrogenase (short-subunit alcohol dehydrogenase family)